MPPDEGLEELRRAQELGPPRLPSTWRTMYLIPARSIRALDSLLLTVEGTMKTYDFNTIWRIKGPIESVWNEIYHSELWPTWWKGVEDVVEVRAGDETGVG